MGRPKIVIVGAGSGSFGPRMLLDAAMTPEVRGATLTLVDLDEAKLGVVAGFAGRASEAFGADLTVETAVGTWAVDTNAESELTLNVTIPDTKKDDKGAYGYAEVLGMLPPDLFVKTLIGLGEQLPSADRVTVGMPGMLRHGVVVATPHYVTRSGPRTPSRSSR